MYTITIYNFVINEMKNFNFNTLLEAEEFAGNYEISENEEISIGNGIYFMDWIDYLSR